MTSCRQFSVNAFHIFPDRTLKIECTRKDLSIISMLKNFLENYIALMTEMISKTKCLHYFKTNRLIRFFNLY